MDVSDNGPGPSGPAKKRKLEKKDSSKHLQAKLQAIHAIHKKIYALEKQRAKKIFELANHCDNLRKPYFDQRNKSINKIKDFWRLAIHHHPILTSLLADPDTWDCFEYLRKFKVDIETELFVKKVLLSYRFKFYFRPNPFFINSKIVKKLVFDYSLDLNAPGPNPQGIWSTQIQWKNGMDLSTRVAVDGPTKKAFFSWFCENDGLPLDDSISMRIITDLWPFGSAFYEMGIEEEEEEFEEDEELENEEEEDEELFNYGFEQYARARG